MTNSYGTWIVYVLLALMALAIWIIAKLLAVPQTVKDELALSHYSVVKLDIAVQQDISFNHNLWCIKQQGEDEGVIYISSPDHPQLVPLFTNSFGHLVIQTCE